MSRIPTLWLRGGPARRGREAPLGPELALRVPLAGSTWRQPRASPTWSLQQPLLASSAGRVAGALGPVSPPPRPRPGGGLRVRAPRSGRARYAASTRSPGSARAKRRSQGHRAGGVGSPRAEEADFLGPDPWGYHGVWEESPGSLCDFRGPPHR